MNTAHLTIQVRVAWWVRWYIAGVALCAWVTGLEPDAAKVSATVQRGTRLVIR